MNWELVISILALAAGAWAGLRGLSLQRRVTELEEKRQADQLEQQKSADVRVALGANRRELGNLKYTDHFLRIDNHGPATATDVNLRIFQERDPSKAGFSVPYGDSELPIQRLAPGDACELFAVLDLTDAGPFAYQLTWSDGRGSQKRESRLSVPGLD